MKFFLTATLLVAAFACINAETLEEVEQDVENMRNKLIKEGQDQTLEWQNIREDLKKNKSAFEKYAEEKNEEVNNGIIDAETAKEQLYEKLDEFSEEYTDAATPPYRAWQSAMESGITEVYEKITKLSQEDQERIRNTFERAMEDINREYDSIFRPVNALVVKNAADGRALIKSLFN